MKTSMPFAFNDPREFLSWVFREKREKNPRFSIRAWSYQLGFKNPSLLSEVLRGQRKVSFKLAQKIGEQLGLNEEQKTYFQALVGFQNARNEAERGLYIRLLESFQPGNGSISLSVDQFRLIADWYHLAIFELTALEGFSSEPKWISQKLGGAVSVEIVKDAISRLVRLGLLTQTAGGGLVRAKKTRFSTGESAPSDAIRKFHRQMIDHALKAMDGQSIQERHISGSTLPIHRKDYEKIVALIRDCHERALASAQSAGADDLYQLNVQFFRLSQRKGEK